MAKRRRKKPDLTDLVRRDGALVLTFVNTEARQSWPGDYAGLVAWADRYGAVPSSSVSRLVELAAERPDEAAAAFADARELHTLLSRTVNAVVDREPPPAPDVRDLDALLAKVAPRRVLASHGSRLGWAWPEDLERELFAPLWPVAQSATDLLTSEDCGRVRRCAAEDCALLFLSKGAGMPRKWCGESCSAPFRSREYYRRVTKPWRQKLKEKRARR